MRILVASPSRDLLESFKMLFTQDGYEVMTAFDGIQAMDRLAERPDVAVIDRNIPRVDHRRLVGYADEEGIPTVMAVDRRIDVRLLSERPLASSLIAFPFLYEELADRVKTVAALYARGETIEAAGITVSEKDRTLCGIARLTAEETEVFRDLISGAGADDGRRAVYIDSINSKLRALNKTAQIKYITNEGYKLVTDNE